MMCKVIEAWNVTGKGDYLLTLNEKVPNIVFDSYQIDGRNYPMVPVHVAGRLDMIGVKTDGKVDFVGKEVIFTSSLPRVEHKKKVSVA
ncbi:MAG: hypothetical protein IJS96_03185 [Schwartzia sp.]|nr:hypothetical protein [Schwartzia sp. (in: firmicutes)]